jgi:hypothetical protein
MNNEPTTTLRTKDETLYRTLTEAEKERIRLSIQSFHEDVKLCIILLAWAIGISLLIIWTVL